MEHLFKLKNDDKETVGYLLLKCGAIFWKTRYKSDEWTCNPEFAFDWASAHPFVTKDKNGNDVFTGDRVSFWLLGCPDRATGIIKWQQKGHRFVFVEDTSGSEWGFTDKNDILVYGQELIEEEQ